MPLTLVLGGGGSAAIAWHVGVLAGLAEENVRLDPDQVIGTSAGAIVATQLTGPAGLAALYERALTPPPQHLPAVDFPALMSRLGEIGAGASGAREGRRRIGEFALAAQTMSEADRRAEIASRLGRTSWPDRPALLITAVDAGTGEFVTFHRASDVELLDAVGASAAVPGVWPPVSINGVRYVDGAVRSPTNASAATGASTVLVLAPLLPPGGVQRELSRLDPPPASMVLTADEATLTAFGPNPLDAGVSAASAAAGRRQGRAAADDVRRLLAAHRGEGACADHAAGVDVTGRADSSDR